MRPPISSASPGRCRTNSWAPRARRCSCLLGAVLCVLLIVVANVANLLMARATVRARELAIRSAIGAARSSLIRQLLTESVLIALVGGGLGVLFAFWGLDLILALDPGEVPRVAPIGINGQVLGFALALSALTGILFGVVPAWQASVPDLQHALKDTSRGHDGERRAASGARLARPRRGVPLAGPARGRGPVVPQPDDAHRHAARVHDLAHAHDADGADRRELPVPGPVHRLLGSGPRARAGGAGRGARCAHHRAADGRQHQHPDLRRGRQAGDAAQPATPHQLPRRVAGLLHDDGDSDPEGPGIWPAGCGGEPDVPRDQRGDGAARVSGSGSRSAAGSPSVRDDAGQAPSGRRSSGSWATCASIAPTKTLCR